MRPGGTLEICCNHDRHLEIQSSLQDFDRNRSPLPSNKLLGYYHLSLRDIGGNKYRLVARIRYDYQLVNVRAVMTHNEYNESKWKQ